MWKESETGPGSALYQELPPITIGGEPGSYEVPCPIASCRWAEFAIDSVVNGDAGTAALFVTGNSAPGFEMNYAGVNSLSNDEYVYGTPIRVPATTTLPINGDYQRITNSERKVFVRIDGTAGGSTYVTLRFRARILERIPGPSKEVHPDHAHELNKLRADNVNQRLAELGIPKYANEANRGAKD